MRKTPVGMIFCVALLVVATAATVHAQTFSGLYNFNGSTSDPIGFSNPGTLAQGQGASVYTTSTSGGQIIIGEGANGTVFSLSPSGGFAELFTFEYIQGQNNNDGCNPYSGLTLGTDGNFYGTTPGCGAGAIGTVFKITPAGSLTTLYNFTGGSDGSEPFATPVQGNDGAFYGTTVAGGTFGYGTVYKITSSGTFTALYQFDGVLAASNYAPLVLGTDGNFYGTGLTGTNLLGVIYKITPAGKFTVLYNFDGTHGEFPIAPLVQGSDGSFYGTTEEGGTGFEGLVFKITSTGKLTVLHNLNGTVDGASPVAGLVQATDGNFYGVAESGGPSNNGTVFKISPTKPYPYHVLYNFDGTTGAQPEVTLLQHTNGLLYGLSTAGGTFNFGTFYSVNIGLGPFVTLVTTSGKTKATVEILGQGFTGTTGVSFGGKAATFQVKSDTYLTATVPSGALTGSVVVTTPGGTLTSSKTFRITPQLKSFTPPSGVVGTAVTITGVSLTQTSKVTFGGVAATFTVNSDLQVTATVPTGAKTGKIVITTPGGTATSATSFTVTP